MTRGRRPATVAPEVSVTAGPHPPNAHPPDPGDQGDAADEAAAADQTAAGRRGVRVVTDVPRQMVRVAWRDPEHICERLTLQAVHRLAEPSLQWAQATRDEHIDGDLQSVLATLTALGLLVALSIVTAGAVYASRR